VSPAPGAPLPARPGGAEGAGGDPGRDSGGAAGGGLAGGRLTMLTGLAEIVLWAHDLESCLAFYRDLLGLEVISPPGFPKVFLSAGTGSGGVPEMIVLMPHPEAAGAFPGTREERVLHHLALAAHPDGYDVLEARCREAGLEVRQGVHPVLPGVRTFYVDDPEGNEVEIIAPGR
jgi:catechol 2,3-dioxygenase-like lactoylglutathione lyase family enzyme